MSEWINELKNTHDELSAQLEQCTARQKDVTNQFNAAKARQADLEQQLEAVSAEMARLGMMQLGKKMMLRAEQDNIRKKLNANKELQESLKGRLQKLVAEGQQLRQDLEQARRTLEAAETPAVEEGPATAEPAVPVEEPVKADVPVPKPAPAPKKPVIRKPAAPRGPSPRKVRVELEALPLTEQTERLLALLSPYYPEKQVFAPEVLPSALRESLAAVAARSGFDGPAAFLKAQGWQTISAAQARSLRQGMYCTPGEEPEIIRPRLQNVLQRLEKHYPERVIAVSIQHDHKSLAQDVSALHQWLGYASVGAMLTAYGFRYDVRGGGRPATDAAQLVDALRAAYADSPKPGSIARIMADHPEYAAALKTLQNQAPRRFGMSLRQYLQQEGVL